MIEVRVSLADYLNCRSAILVEAMVLEKLRVAGMPVRGSLRFGGIERGRLTIFDDPADSCRVFVWGDDVPA